MLDSKPQKPKQISDEETEQIIESEKKNKYSLQCRTSEKIKHEDLLVNIEKILGNMKRSLLSFSKGLNWIDFETFEDAEKAYEMFRKSVNNNLNVSFPVASSQKIDPTKNRISFLAPANTSKHEI